jgi:hypothetical protein
MTASNPAHRLDGLTYEVSQMVATDPPPDLASARQTMLAGLDLVRAITILLNQIVADLDSPRRTVLEDRTDNARLAADLAAERFSPGVRGH